MNRKSVLLAVLVSLVVSTGGAAEDPLPSWKDGAAKSAILAFVERATKAGSPDLVPVAERVAVFDNDGTLWSERPFYFQLAFALDRIRGMAPDHPEWKEKEPYASALRGDAEGLAASGKKGLLEIVAASHAGMTTEEFRQAVLEWLDTAEHPTLGRRYLDAVYQPQLELLAFLRSQGFSPYIVSGGGVDFMRPWTEAVYGIPPQQVVGSSLEAKYEVRDGEPAIVKQPEVDFIDDGPEKPVGIQRYIGVRPILAFGNSDGDFQMLEYVTAGPGPRLGLLLHHDDAEREFAYDRESHVGRLARGLDEAASRGWVVVSMKKDWGRIFPAR